MNAKPASGPLWLFLIPAVVQWLALLPLRVVMILLGLVVVPLALPWRRRQRCTRRPFTQAEGSWELVTLPRWAWLWSNDRDGALGDKRGWWHKNAPLGLGADHWFSMFWWLAIRNPANNMRFTRLFGCPVTQTRCVYWGQREVEDDPGRGGWRFTWARGGGWSWFGFYWVREWSATRALVVQLGFKGEPEDWDEDYADDLSRQWKGFTFEINPVKNID